MKRQFMIALCGCLGLQLVPATVCAENKTAVDYESKYNELLDDYNELSKKYNDLLKSIDNESESDTALTDSEILFRNIHWGTKFSDVKKLFPSCNFSDVSYPRYYESYSKDIVSGYLNIYANGDRVTMVVEISGDKLEIDNHSISGLELFFAYDTVDGYIDYNADNALLYGASYRVDFDGYVPSTQEFSEFIEAFRKEYGDPTQNYFTKNINEIEMQYLVWETQDCIASVHTEPHQKILISEYNAAVEVDYAWKGGDELLKEAKEAVKNVKVLPSK